MRLIALRVAAAAVVFAAGPVLAAPWDDDCAHKADREAALDAAGARSVRVEAGAGSLRVEGRTGVTRVEAHGTACASNESVLGQIRLTAVRQGDVIVIKAEIPDRSSWIGNDQARLDLVVGLPRLLPVKVEDGSGSATIAHVGPLTVHDGSGELIVSDVAGDVAIEDGSGSIEVDGVTGSVRLSDGSGSIAVHDVSGSVTVDEDGSGSIEVASVKGDFTVSRDGSGGIDHREVAGQVRIPGDRRHH
jgi:DUF4097 and DUF4098 domain-containing protein YvlB